MLLALCQSAKVTKKCRTCVVSLVALEIIKAGGKYMPFNFLTIRFYVETKYNRVCFILLDKK